MRRKFYTSFVVLVALLTATILGWLYMSNSVKNLAFERFKQDTVSETEKIQNFLGFYLNALYGAQSFYELNPPTSRKEFDAYFKNLVLPKKYPGLRAIAFVEKVSAQNMPVFINKMKQEGYTNFKVTPAGNRPEYYVIKYNQPEIGNETALGVDLFSFADRKTEIQKSIDTGEVVTTGKIDVFINTLVNKTGVVVFIPVYRFGMPLKTVTERRNATLGVLDEVFLTKDLFQAISLETPDVDLEVFDGITPSAENLLYDSDSSLTSNQKLQTRFAIKKQINVDGRIWTLGFRASSKFQLSYITEYSPLVVLIFGTLFSFLIFYIIYKLSSSKEQAEQLVKKRTLELAESISLVTKSNEEISKKATLLSKQNTNLEETKKSILNLLEDLQQEKAKSEATLLSIGDGLIVVDKDAKIAMVNDTFEKLLGWKREEVLGKNLIEIIPWEDEKGNRIEFSKRALPQTLTGKKILTTTATTTTTENESDITLIPVFYYVRKDGTRFPVVGTFTPIVINGKITGAVEIFHDITKEKELDRAKNEFLSVASHQLRTPLSSIKWTLELFMQDKGLTKKEEERLKDLYISNERLIDLVNNLLNVARIETGKIVLNKKPTNIKDLIEASMRELKPSADKKRQKINFANKTKTKESNLDPLILGEAINNLLANAINYAPKNSDINIEVAIKDNNYLVSIHNLNLDKPIPKSDFQKIFEKFHRGVDAVKIKAEGSGLGLFIAKGAVESSGGTIWVKSSVNKGTTFYFTIPIK